MGFAKENIILVERARALETRVEAFKTELLKNPKILAVASQTSNLLLFGVWMAPYNPL